MYEVRVCFGSQRVVHGLLGAADAKANDLLLLCAAAAGQRPERKQKEERNEIFYKNTTNCLHLFHQQHNNFFFELNEHVYSKRESFSPMVEDEGVLEVSCLI